MKDKQSFWWCGFKIESEPPSEFFMLLAKHYPPQKRSEDISLFTSCIRKTEIWSGHFLADFANALCNRMRWRGISNGLPKWIGYPFASWEEQGAFDALLVDSVDYAIVKKISGLFSALKKYDNIDFMVYNNIKFFLHERQRHCDPIGYAVGKNAQEAVQQALEKGVFAAKKLNNQGKVNNTTILRIYANCSAQQPCNKESLKHALRHSKAWPKVQLKLVEMRKEVQAELCQVVCQLAEKGGITSFKFGDLAKIMKDEVRSAWQSSHVVLEGDDWEIEVSDDEEFNQLIQQLDNRVKIIKFDTTDEQWESWKALIKQIKSDIDKLNCSDKVRQRIHDAFQAIVEFIEVDEEVPPQAQLAKRLKISKSTFGRDMEMLRQLFNDKWHFWTKSA